MCGCVGVGVCVGGVCGWVWGVYVCVVCVCVCMHTGEGLEGYNKANIETSFRKTNDHITGKLVFAVPSVLQIPCK